MDDTPNLKLPYIAAAQAQKHVTHNEAIRALDALVQIAVADRNLATPPSSPVEGARYIVASSPTGAWAGHANKIAAWQDGAWMIYPPLEGWSAWISDEDVAVVWSGAAWTPLGAGASVNPAPLVGINTAADTTNRLAVKSNAVLLSHDDVTPGTGDIQAKINKSSAVRTATFLFQSGFSGRAEMGLAGEDDFSFKVSANGSAWVEALRIDRSTGRVSMPLTPGRELLTSNRTYFVRTDGNDSNSGLSNSPAGAFATIGGAYSAVAARIDAAGYTVTFQIAAGTYAASILLNRSIPNASAVMILGNTAAPSSVAVTPSGYGGFTIDGQAVSISGMRISNAGATGQGVLIRNRGTLNVEAGVEFGACPNRAHMEAIGGSSVNSTQNWSIVGGAQSHVLLSGQSTWTASGRTITIGGTPAFTSAFLSAAQGSSAVLFSNTWSGAATGSRYAATGNSIVDTFGAGASHLPGSIAGTVASGGEYA